MSEDPTHGDPTPTDPTPPDPTVARATPEHAAVLARLLHDFNTEFDTPVPPRADLERRFAALLARDDVLALLTGPADDPTGFALLTLRPTPYHDGPLAQLEELYVRPGLRDHGLGTALLTAAVEEVRARGAGETHIGVDEIDTDTRRFYERHGFTNVEPGQDYRMLLYLREL